MVTSYLIVADHGDQIEVLDLGSTPDLPVEDAAQVAAIQRTDGGRWAVTRLHLPDSIVHCVTRGDAIGVALAS